MGFRGGGELHVPDVGWHERRNDGSDDVLRGLFLLVLLALAVAALIWIVRQLRGSRPTALPELDRRYAAGEIGRDEYRAAREDLRG